MTPSLMSLDRDSVQWTGGVQAIKHTTFHHMLKMQQRSQAQEATKTKEWGSQRLLSTRHTCMNRDNVQRFTKSKILPSQITTNSKNGQ